MLIERHLPLPGQTACLISTKSTTQHTCMRIL